MMRKLFALCVAAMAFMAPTAAAFAAPTEIRLCTGADGGPYAEAGKMIASMAKNDPNITITVVTDTGGTWANIQKTIQGDECDAMIGQPDGAALLKRQNPGDASKMMTVGPVLHREYLHALCSKASGVDDIGDLESDPKGNGYSIALGDPGSGAWLVWQNFVAQDSDYGAVPVKTEGDVIALSQVAADETTCMLQPAALGNSLVKQADEQFGDGLALVGVNDRDFDNAKDLQDKALYAYSEIPSGTYAKSLQGWFSGKSTLTWMARVYVNTDRLSANKPLGSFITAVARAAPGIQAKYGK